MSPPRSGPPAANPEGVLSNLPAWIKSAKHRDEVVRAIHRLRAAAYA
jgi:hypothetical protein